jgi:hypothetical protein
MFNGKNSWLLIILIIVILCCCLGNNNEGVLGESDCGCGA